MTNDTTAPDAKPVLFNGRPGQKGGDALVLALATGASVPQAAERAGIAVSTAYRRLENPTTRRAVSRARDELLAQAVGRLLAVAGRAIDTLEAHLDADIAAIRIRAALGILANMLKGVDSVELARRLTELEDQRQ
jgi:hypothetical protein